MIILFKERENNFYLRKIQSELLVEQVFYNDTVYKSNITLLGYVNTVSFWDY